jgi:hypothetical protein
MSLESLLRTKIRTIVPSAILAVLPAITSPASANPGDAPRSDASFTPIERSAVENGRSALQGHTFNIISRDSYSPADGFTDFYKHTSNTARELAVPNHGKYVMPQGLGSGNHSQSYLFSKYGSFCNILEKNGEDCKSFVIDNVSFNSGGSVVLNPAYMKVVCILPDPVGQVRDRFTEPSDQHCSVSGSRVFDVVYDRTHAPSGSSSFFSSADEYWTPQGSTQRLNHIYFRRGDTLRVHLGDDYMGRQCKVNPQSCAPAPQPTKPACSDGVDNDGDSLIDMADPGCTGADDIDEGNNVVVPYPVPPVPPVPPNPVPACSDGVDNDNDSFIDLFDPGCNNNPAGSSEWNLSPDPSPNPWPVPPPTPDSKMKKDLDLRVGLGYWRNLNQHDMPGFNSAYLDAGATWYPRSWRGHGIGLGLVFGLPSTQEYTLDSVVHRANPADPYGLTGVHTQSREYSLWSLDLVPHLTLRPGTDWIYFNGGLGIGLDFVKMSSTTNERLLFPNRTVADESTRDTTGVGGSETYVSGVLEFSLPIALGKALGWDPLYLAPTFRARVPFTEGSTDMPTRSSLGVGGQAVFMW